MAISQDEYRLEDLARRHEISTGLFVPFVIRRLRASAEGTEAVFAVSLRNIGSKEENHRALRVYWSDSRVPEQPLGVPEHTVTEFAALGVACMVVSLYAGLRIQAVTAQGDRFDYWTSDGQKDYGLEVSGTLAGDVEIRHATKVRQWGENPYGVDGHVVTVGFTNRQIIFSCHRFEETRT